MVIMRTGTSVPTLILSKSVIINQGASCQFFIFS